MSIEYVDVTVPQGLLDLMAEPEPPYRLVRPPAETVDEVERWLWLQAHDWSRATPEYRRSAAGRLLFLLWLVDRRRVGDA